MFSGVIGQARRRGFPRPSSPVGEEILTIQQFIASDYSDQRIRLMLLLAKNHPPKHLFELHPIEEKEEAGRHVAINVGPAGLGGFFELGNHFREIGIAIVNYPRTGMAADV